MTSWQKLQDTFLRFSLLNHEEQEWISRVLPILHMKKDNESPYNSSNAFYKDDIHYVCTIMAKLKIKNYHILQSKGDYFFFYVDHD